MVDPYITLTYKMLENVPQTQSKLIEVVQQIKETRYST